MPSIVVENLPDSTPGFAAQERFASILSTPPPAIPLSEASRSDRDNAPKSDENPGSPSATDQSHSSMYEKIDDLTRFKCSNGVEAGFAPQHTLRNMFRTSNEGLENLLKEKLTERTRLDSSPTIQELVTFICDKAPKAFATLVFSEREHLILRFFKNGFDDSLLPVVKKGGTTLISFPADADVQLAGLAATLANEQVVEIKKLHDQDSTKRFAQRVKDAQDSAKRCAQLAKDAGDAAASANAKVAAAFDGCGRQDTDKFYEYQWRFTAPVFKAESFKYIFADKAIMPFWPSVRTLPGIFSSVEKRQIHPDHLPGNAVSLSPIATVTSKSNEIHLLGDYALTHDGLGRDRPRSSPAMTKATHGWQSRCSSEMSSRETMTLSRPSSLRQMCSKS